jgi:nicotinic acid mononucleotide adenylyltransferase
MARAAMAECGLDEVWFLVNPAPEHKQGVTVYGARAEMVRMALVGEDLIRLDDPSGLILKEHSWAEFKRLMGRYPEREFRFIVGPEVLEHWEQWRRADAEMAAEAQFLVARRGEAAEVELDKRLHVRWFGVGEHAGVSSGRIRRALAVGEAPVGLDERVKSYIRAEHLYGA